MPISGMTGFSRVEGQLGAWRFAIEARSVNGRTLEVRYRGPSGLEGLDRLAKAKAAELFGRGQIQLSVNAKKAETDIKVRVNSEQLEQFVALCDQLQAEGKAVMPRADGLLALKGVIETIDADTDAESEAEATKDLNAALESAVLEALQKLKRAREEEGAALLPILSGQFDQIEAIVRAAEAEAASQSQVIRDRFTRRVQDLMGDQAESLEDRIMAEAALLAVKADVREELDRLYSHINAARTLLASEGASGRRLDFLAQEFNREANTLCSKSATNALTRLGLDLKAVIEQMREQVQNVE